MSRPALGPTQPPVQWVPGVLSPGVKRGRGVMLTTHLHLVPRSWMSRSYTPLPPSASMACRVTALLFYYCPPTHRSYWTSLSSDLTLLLRIREVTGSNLGLETGSPDWGFSCFSSVPPSKSWDSAFKLGHDRFLPHPFPIIHLKLLNSTQYNVSLKIVVK
jgi:hypothetical protein